jgi:hypothetical protein
MNQYLNDMMIYYMVLLNILLKISFFQIIKMFAIINISFLMFLKRILIIKCFLSRMVYLNFYYVMFHQFINFLFIKYILKLPISYLFNFVENQHFSLQM